MKSTQNEPLLSNTIYLQQPTINNCSPSQVCGGALKANVSVLQLRAKSLTAMQLERPLIVPSTNMQK